MIRRLDTDKGYVKYHLEDPDNSIWIIDAIEANGRRNGNGSSLLKEVEEIIRNEGGRRIELYAYPQDDSITEDELCDFYHINGYEDNEVKCDFSKEI